MPNWKKVIVSGSNVSQLNNDGVYLRTTGDGVISSSAQLTGTFDTRYLNTTGDGVISSSAQIKTQISGAFTAPSGGFSTRLTSLEAAGGTTFSSSIASRVTTVETDLNTLESKTLVSSSAQLTPTFDTRYLNTIGDGVISSSAQLTPTFDTRYLNTIGDGVISSSAQVNHDATTNFVANEHIDHTTVSITAGSGLSGGGTIAATRTLTLNTSSAHFTDGVKKKLNTEGVISSSAQLTGTFDTRYLNTIGDNVISSSAQVTISSTTGYTTFSSSIASDIAALGGAGYVDTTGTPANNQISIFHDSNTIKGDDDLIYYSGSSSTFYAIGSTHGLAFFPETVAAGIKSPTLLVDSIIVGDNTVGTGNADFTSSFTMIANAGPSTFAMETILAAATLTGAQSATTIYTTKNAATALWVNYHINRNGGHRVGQLMVAIDGSNNVTLTDVSTADIGGSTSDVSFSATAASGIIQLKITSAGSVSYEIEVKKLS